MGVCDTWSGSEKVRSSVYPLMDGYRWVPAHFLHTLTTSSRPKYKNNVYDHTKCKAIYIVLPPSGEMPDILLAIRATQYIFQFQQSSVPTAPDTPWQTHQATFLCNLKKNSQVSHNLQEQISWNAHCNMCRPRAQMFRHFFKVCSVPTGNR